MECKKIICSILFVCMDHHTSTATNHILKQFNHDHKRLIQTVAALPRRASDLGPMGTMRLGQRRPSLQDRETGEIREFINGVDDMLEKLALEGRTIDQHPETSIHSSMNASMVSMSRCVLVSTAVCVGKGSGGAGAADVCLRPLCVVCDAMIMILSV